MSSLNSFDEWLVEGGPAALVIREPLMPVEGEDGVLFPPTYAPAEDKSKFAGGYNIDSVGDGRNVCLIDSVGSQANRIEPLFSQEGYASLIPQVTIRAGSRTVNLLEAGHRAGDAIIRCSELQQELKDAFNAVQRGDAQPLAKIAPTSLVFGVWDSRGTQAKVPRLVSSTIRAFDVAKLTRSAQYVPAAEYINEELLEDTDDKKLKEGYSKQGFIHVPASGAPGGVIAHSGIRRDATLSLSALRLLHAGKDHAKTLVLRRYVLGLALAALTHNSSGYLRQGCNLVPNPDKPREFKIVASDGQRTDATFSHDDVVRFATAAAIAFGVGPNREVAFDKVLAKADVSGEEPGAEKSKKSTKKK